MPSSIQHLIDGNHAWADRMEYERPGFFHALAQQQKPDYLWIVGHAKCSEACIHAACS